MSVWLGRPGQLVQITSPLAGMKAAIERQSTARTTLGGGRSVDYAPGVLRTWTWEHRYLSNSDHGTLMAYYAGHHGMGPWVLVDDADVNLLTPEQSSATSATSTTTGFVADAGTLVSAAWGDPRGPRQLAWDLAGQQAATLSLSAPCADWLGTPVVRGVTYRWQAQVAGLDLDMDVTVGMRWLDVLGSTIATSLGTATYAPTGPTVLSVQAECPLGAAWVVPEISAAVGGGYVTAAAGGFAIVGPGFRNTLLVDYPQLAIPTVRDDGTTWVPGLGVPQVTLPSLDHTFFVANRHDDSLTLIEVK